MLLDNLFAMLGGLGTSALLCGIIAIVGAPAIGSVACPTTFLRRLQPPGR